MKLAFIGPHETYLLAMPARQGVDTVKSRAQDKQMSWTSHSG